MGHVPLCPSTSCRSHTPTTKSRFTPLSPTPPATEGVPEDVREDMRGDTCGADETCCKPFVEHFPDKRAGAPVKDTRVESENLRAYMRSCGDLANSAHFETAELLMSSGMTDKARDKHHLNSTVARHRGQQWAQ